MKKRVFIVSAVSLAIAAALFVILQVVDFSGRLAVMSSMVHEKTGKHLSINGPVRLRIRFSPSVVFHDLSFSDTSGGSPLMIRVRKMMLTVEPAALLKKKIIIRQLTVDRVDVCSGEKPVDPASCGDASTRKTVPAYLFSREQIPRDLFDGLGLDTDVRINELHLGWMMIQDIHSRIVLENGMLRCDPFSGRIYSGRLDGHITTAAPKGELTIGGRLEIQSLDTGQMCGQLGLGKKVMGALTGHCEFEGKGTSVARIMAGLNGNVWALMGDSRIESGFVHALGADLLTSALSFLNPLDRQAENNRLNCAAVRVEFENGLGRVKILLADTPEMTASGNGLIDLRRETLDISVRPSVKKGIGTSDRQGINVSLARLVRAFKIGGTFRSPQVIIDRAEAAKSAIKTAGGMVLLGPVGIAAALVGVTSAEQNPCPCALSIAKTGRTDGCDLPAAKNKSRSWLDSTTRSVKKLFNGLD